MIEFCKNLLQFFLLSCSLNNRSQQLEAENYQLKSKRCKCENDQDPVKKDRYGDELDPFKLLPPHCQEVIFNQLDKIDIFYMTKVSNYWKLVVESDKGAAAKLKEALTLKTESVEDLRLLNDASFKYAFLSNETIDWVCLNEFSASLEEVTIQSKFICDVNTRLPAIKYEMFPKLLRLDIKFEDLHSLNLFSHCDFPMLNYFRLIYSEDSYQNVFHTNQYMERNFAIRLQNVLGKMPKLEHFVFLCPRRIHIWDSDQTPLMASPQLKTLQLPKLYEGSIASLLLLEELTIYDELKSSDFFLMGKTRLSCYS